MPHSPGPWKVKRVDSGTIPGTVQHPVYWAIKGPEYMASINVYRAHKQTLETAEANATLIASAPELLEVAQWADRILRAVYTTKAANNIPALQGTLPQFKRLQDAIAKATTPR